MCVFFRSPGPAKAGQATHWRQKTRFSCFAPHKRTRARGPPRQVAERGAKKHKHTRSATPALLSDRACVVCPLARARLLGGKRGSSAARSEERSERQRTRADREPRQRKADFPWRPRTPRAPHRAPRASRARSFCARLARRRSRGAERTEQERARSRGKPQGSPGRPFPRTRTASSEGARRSDSPRAARVVLCATCTARPRVVRTPPARGGARERRARNGATGQQRQNRATNRPAKHRPRAPRALGARIPHAPCASRRASRAPRTRS